MLKLIIADANEICIQALAKQCKNLLEIYPCSDGVQVLEMVRKIEPHILVLDLHLPEISGLDVLRIIRSSGNELKVIVTGFLKDDRIFKELSDLRISGFLSKPYSSGAVVALLQDLALEIQFREQPYQCPQRALNHMLLNLGFRMGLSRYQYVYQAIMLKYGGECGSITKCLYPKVAKICGGNVAQVEKAVRDAIKDAFNQGNACVWQMYFPSGNCGEIRHPTNEVFLGRMVYALQEQFGVTRNQIAQ